MEVNKIHHIDTLEGVSLLLPKSIHCCISSIPYYALRDYNLPKSKWPEVTYSLFSLEIVIPEMECCLGLEENAKAFVGHIVHIYRGIKEGLRDDGTCWLNIGDSYVTSPPGNINRSVSDKDGVYNRRMKRQLGHGEERNNIYKKPKDLKSKDLYGIPWMLAFAMREDGWYLRQDIIWSKPNPMPESVTDRCTKAHEYIFLLTKSTKYYYDAEAIKTPIADASVQRLLQDIENQAGSDRVPGKTNGRMKAVGCNRKSTIHNNEAANDGINGKGFIGHSGHYNKKGNLIGGGKANKRSVWSITTKPFSDAHFATFPEDLIVDMIKAGSSEHGCCANCWSPYERATEKVGGMKCKNGTQHKAKQMIVEHRGDSSLRTSMHTTNAIAVHETTGWSKTCKCETDEIRPSIILDPFMGAGTTALVSAKLNRSFIGFEFNGDYIKIAKKRLQKELGMFNTLLV